MAKRERTGSFERGTRTRWRRTLCQGGQLCAVPRMIGAVALRTRTKHDSLQGYARLILESPLCCFCCPLPLCGAMLEHAASKSDIEFAGKPDRLLFGSGFFSLHGPSILLWPWWGAAVLSESGRKIAQRSGFEDPLTYPKACCPLTCCCFACQVYGELSYQISKDPLMYGGQFRVSKTKRTSLSGSRRPPEQQAMSPARSGQTGVKDDDSMSHGTSRSAASNWQTRKRPPSTSDSSSESRSWASDDIKAAAAARMSATTLATPAAAAGQLATQDDLARRREPADPLGLGWADGLGDSDLSSSIPDTDLERHRPAHFHSHGGGPNWQESLHDSLQVSAAAQGASYAEPLMRADMSPSTSAMRSPRQAGDGFSGSHVGTPASTLAPTGSKALSSAMLPAPTSMPVPMGSNAPNSAVPLAPTSTPALTGSSAPISSLPLAPTGTLVPASPGENNSSQSSHQSSARGRTSPDRPAAPNISLPTDISLMEVTQFGDPPLASEAALARDHDEFLMYPLAVPSSPTAEPSSLLKGQESISSMDVTIAAGSVAHREPERSSSNNDDWPDTDDDRRDDQQAVLSKSDPQVGGHAGDMFVPPPREVITAVSDF